MYLSKCVQRNMHMLKAWDFNKNATDTLIIICRKFFEQIFFRMAQERYF